MRTELEQELGRMQGSVDTLLHWKGYSEEVLEQHRLALEHHARVFNDIRRAVVIAAVAFGVTLVVLAMMVVAK